jgi:MFS family permease
MQGGRSYGVRNPARMPGDRLTQLTIGLVLLEIAGGMQLFTLGTVMPVVAESLHGGSLYATTLAAGAVAMFATLPLAPPAIQRYGLRPVVTFGTVIYIAGAVLSAAAPAMPVFTIGRAVQGLGAGFVAALGLGAVAVLFPPERRARVLSLLSTAWIVPGLAGPPFAAFVTAAFGWRVAVIALVPLIVAARFFIAGRFDADAPARDAPLPFVATGAFVVAVAVALAGERVAPPFGVAIALVAIAVTLVTASRFVPAGTIRLRRGAPAAIAAMFVASFAFNGADSFMSLAIIGGMRRSILLAGVVMAGPTFTWVLASFLYGRLVERRGVAPARLASLGGVLIAGGLVQIVIGIARTPPDDVALACVFAGWLVAGGGMGLCYPAMSQSAIDVDGAAATLAAGAVVLAELLGATLSRVAGGFFVGAGTAHAQLAGLYACFALAAAALPFVAYRIALPRRDLGISMRRSSEGGED